MTISKVAAALFFLAAIPLTWICVFLCYRKFRADRLRCRLHALRSRLRDIAASAPAAAFVLEGWLRDASACAAHLTGSRVILFAIGSRFSGNTLPLRSYENWRDALAAVQPDTRDAVTLLHSEMRKTLLTHIMSGSPLLWILLPLGLRRSRLWTSLENGFLEDLIANTAALSVLRTRQIAL